LTVWDGPKGQRRLEEDASLVPAFLIPGPLPSALRSFVSFRFGLEPSHQTASSSSRLAGYRLDAGAQSADAFRTINASVSTGAEQRRPCPPPADDVISCRVTKPARQKPSKEYEKGTRTGPVSIFRVGTSPFHLFLSACETNPATQSHYHEPFASTIKQYDVPHFLSSIDSSKNLCLFLLSVSDDSFFSSCFRDVTFAMSSSLSTRSL